MKTICTLQNMLRRNVELNPEKIALIEGKRSYTFREFADRSQRMGNALLNLGLAKGDRVAILSKNSIENAESYFSIPNAGLVLVMLNFRLAPREILDILADAEPRVLLVNEEYVGVVDQLRASLSFVEQFVFIGDRAKTPAGWHHYEEMIAAAKTGWPSAAVTEDDLAALMYTSGTTGAPKGCMAIHRNFYHVGRSLTLALKMDADDCGIIASPLFHATGEVTLMNHVYSGTTSVIMPLWDVDLFLRLVEQYKITTGMLATPMLMFLVDFPHSERYDHSSLKKIYFAGAPVTPVVFQKAIERFGNVFIHLFGTSETIGQTTILSTDDVARALASGKTEILASCGKSFADMESVVVDEDDRPVPPGVVGEIKVRGLGTTLGYWRKEEATKAVFRNGWYYPLDLCTVDDQGYIYIVDRKKDMIITGGENVYPAEVENVLYRHPGVSQSAVIGLPDAKWGEAVTAIILPKEGKKLSTDEIISFCKGEIAGYKAPKKIIFVTDMPRSASGKILKYKLREEFAVQ
ncbi:MAG: long-chain-fatty-acid--CoA ligase [Deltaproteobacteria bacterium]|nr:long-chain-fatty-acid--CoA ligase [Candidatus Anaeroferrophillus wilburensis]MBN2888755.1 long-chain-fatty-acid--CoA ligase [Deltaproteobacteria bacterium]